MANVDKNYNLLLAVIKSVPTNGINWDGVGKELGCTRAAAQNRFRRFSVAQGISVAAKAAGVKATGTRAPKGTGKAKGEKRPRDLSEDEDEEEDQTRRSTMKRTKKGGDHGKGDNENAEGNGDMGGGRGNASRAGDVERWVSSVSGMEDGDYYSMGHYSPESRLEDGVAGDEEFEGEDDENEAEA